jgi:uncharacterized membrane protein YphA (DoxX/SURF4 family)
MLQALAGVLLGGVFLWSGTAKLARPAVWRAQAAEFGAPSVAITPLPWVETVLGGALVAQLVRPWPAVVALCLLAVFTVALVQRLAGGRRPMCACFGGVSNRPISWWSVARNLGLMAVAVVAIAA